MKKAEVIQNQFHLHFISLLLKLQLNTFQYSQTKGSGEWNVGFMEYIRIASAHAPLLHSASEFLI